MKSRTVVHPFTTTASVAGAMAALLLSLPGLASAAGGGLPPANARAPRAVTDLASAIDQTALIVEGVVSNIEYEYSDEAGPWTVITLSGTKSHFGQALGEVKIRQFGGMLPNGRKVVVAEHVIFYSGKRYLVFLRNTAWNLSPVVGPLALRVETVQGREALIDDSGRAVTGVSDGGLELSGAIFENTDFTGAMPNVIATIAEADVRPALDRAQFIAALRAKLDQRGLRVGGVRYDLPAGEFRWRRTMTAPPGGHRGPVDAVQSSRPPEPDTSRPTTTH